MDPCSPSHENESGTCIPKDCRSNQTVLNVAELAVCRGAHLEEQGTRLEALSGSHRVPCHGNFLWRQWLLKDMNNSSTPEGKEKKKFKRGKQRSNGPQRLPRNWQRWFSDSATGVQEGGGGGREENFCFKKSTPFKVRAAYNKKTLNLYSS